MNTTKKILLFFLIFVIFGFTIFLYMPKEEKIENLSSMLKIGAGDDITGLLLEKIIETSKELKIKNTGILDDESLFFDFTFKDC